MRAGAAHAGSGTDQRVDASSVIARISSSRPVSSQRPSAIGMLSIRFNRSKKSRSRNVPPVAVHAASVDGTQVEITPSGSMAWEFISPVFQTSPNFSSNQVSRYYKVPEDWVGPFSQSCSWPQ